MVGGRIRIRPRVCLVRERRGRLRTAGCERRRMRYGTWLLHTCHVRNPDRSRGMVCTGSRAFSANCFKGAGKQRVSYGVCEGFLSTYKWTVQNPFCQLWYQVASPPGCPARYLRSSAIAIRCTQCIHIPRASSTCCKTRQENSSRPKKRTRKGSDVDE